MKATEMMTQVLNGRNHELCSILRQNMSNAAAMSYTKKKKVLTTLEKEMTSFGFSACDNSPKIEPMLRSFNSLEVDHSPMVGSMDLFLGGVQRIQGHLAFIQNYSYLDEMLTVNENGEVSIVPVEFFPVIDVKLLQKLTIKDYIKALSQACENPMSLTVAREYTTSAQNNFNTDLKLTTRELQAIFTLICIYEDPRYFLPSLPLSHVFSGFSADGPVFPNLSFGQSEPWNTGINNFWMQHDRGMRNSMVGFPGMPVSPDMRAPMVFDNNLRIFQPVYSRYEKIWSDLDFVSRFLNAFEKVCMEFGEDWAEVWSKE